MTSSLENNIATYTDYDVIEMEQEMLSVLHEVESYEEDCTANTVKFMQGKINERKLNKMIGTLEETTITIQDSIPSVEEVKTFKEFDDYIIAISIFSSTEAWIGDNQASVNFPPYKATRYRVRLYDDSQISRCYLMAISWLQTMMIK